VFTPNPRKHESLDKVDEGQLSLLAISNVGTLPEN
jgi:hypothetical protein